MIAAGSRWSRHESNADDGPLPSNVEVNSLDYAALRDLYAASRFVVVPLVNVDNQAGITTILEAMAMGTPKSRGHEAAACARRCSPASRPWNRKGSPFWR